MKKGDLVFYTEKTFPSYYVRLGRIVKVLAATKRIKCNDLIDIFVRKGEVDIRLPHQVKQIGDARDWQTFTSDYSTDLYYFYSDGNLVMKSLIGFILNGKR